MALPNIFTREVVDHMIERIDKLNNTSQPLWGKMNVAQMLAHCNVAYELSHENIHPTPGALMKFLLSVFAKKMVVGEQPYKRNIRTAPVFMVSNKQNFDLQKQRLINNLRMVQKEGELNFEGRNNPAFGKLTAKQWNNLYYKHLDHHMAQFAV